MATTTNFGWETPDDTDLVKDGALAMRTLGNAIDASLVDLKGGTTGQVLSKNSNTDMDFTWVTTNDADAIQNSIVDAKGDLITATAADTPARLAVGTNYAFLQADSAETSGLKWANAWTSYTPTVTAGTGSYTSIDVSGGYIRIGKICVVRAYVQVNNKGTAAGVMNVSLPFQIADVRQSGTAADVNFLGTAGSVLLDALSTVMSVAKYDFTTFWENSRGIAIQATYEVA